ncbi:MAG: ABC exporter membrane fusion protein [Cyanobacteria bacterium P01_F01_bin.86]
MSANALNHQVRGVERSRRSWVIAGIIIVGVTGAAWWIWQGRDASVSEPAVTLSAEINTVTALGRLEPEGEVIQLMAPTSAQESRIQELLVQEGDYVEAGEAIAILDNRDILQAALTSAQEQVRIAEAGLAQVQAGAKAGELQAQEAEIARLRAEEAGILATQQATIDRLQAEVDNAQLEYNRYETLYQEGAVSASERDTRELTLATTRQQLQAEQSELSRRRDTSQEQIQRAAATLDQLAEVRSVDVELARAEVAAAMATVKEAESNLEKAYVRSPQAGQIIKIHTRPGENVESEGIATLGQTNQMMAIAEIYQSDIQQIQMGQPVTVTSPVIASELSGTVERIGLQVEQQQVVDEDPAANIDAKVVEVHVRLDEAASQQVAGLTNLQVTVRITTD